MTDDAKTSVRAGLLLMRDHARERLIAYATRHRMRPTGWHFMIDSATGGGASFTESALVIMQCTGARYYCMRITVDSGATAPLDATHLEILSLDSERVAHLIFSRDGWSETRAVKKQSDKIVENAMPAPDVLDDE